MIAKENVGTSNNKMVLRNPIVVLGEICYHMSR